MKSFYALIALALIGMMTGNSLLAQNSKAKSKAANGAMGNMPYTAAYSSQFEISDPSFSAIVLKAWKMYDDNTLKQGPVDFIADTIHAELSNGMNVNGKDSFMTGIESYRDGFTTVTSKVVAYMSVKSIDKHDHLVMIWGTETGTKADGSTQKVDLHEVWGFNKDGKVDFFKQFAVALPDKP